MNVPRISGGKCVGEVDRAAGGRAAGHLVALQLGKVVVGVQVVQRAVLAEAFVEVAALHRMHEWAAVGRVVTLAVGVERDAVAVAAAFAEEFELARDRVIAPEALLEFDAADAARGRAAVDAVEPAVGAPGEMVRQRLGVFHAEAGEQHFRIGVGHVVAVRVGIEQQVRHVEHEHAAVAELDAGGQVQAVDEILGAVGAAVAVGVFKDRDPVRAARAARRRLGHAVVDGPRPAIDFHPLEAGRVRVLQVLDRPQPAAVVALHEDRLPDLGSLAKSVTLRPLAVVMCLTASSRRIALRTTRSGCDGRKDQGFVEQSAAVINDN